MENNITTEYKTPQTPPDQEDGQVICWASVTKICKDENVIKEIGQAILEDAPVATEALTEAVKTKDYANIMLRAHELKGLALAVGAKRLSKTALTLETAAEQKDLKNTDTLLEDIRTEYEKMMSFLSQPNWIEIAKNGQKTKDPK